MIDFGDTVTLSNDFLVGNFSPYLWPPNIRFGSSAPYLRREEAKYIKKSGGKRMQHASEKNIKLKIFNEDYE